MEKANLLALIFPAILFCLPLAAVGTKLAQADSPQTGKAAAENKAVAVIEKTTDGVRQAINELIEAGTTFDVQTLDRIYHADLTVLMIDQSGNVNKANKAEFKGLFEAKKAASEPPLNTWAKFNNVEVAGNSAHVLITRKVKLGETDQKLVLSIDLVFQDGRWQVRREVIFARPDEANG